MRKVLEREVRVCVVAEEGGTYTTDAVQICRAPRWGPKNLLASKLESNPRRFGFVSPFNIVTRSEPKTHNVDSRDICSSHVHALTMSTAVKELSTGSHAEMPHGTVPSSQKAHYEPPWSNPSLIGIAGSSGSGKTSLSLAIIRQLSLPWVVLLGMDSFYKPLTAEQSAAAFRNEYDFDAPEATDFDLLVEILKDIKAG